MKGKVVADCKVDDLCFACMIFSEMIGKPMFFMLSVLLTMHILSSFAGCHKNP